MTDSSSKISMIKEEGQVIKNIIFVVINFGISEAPMLNLSRNEENFNKLQTQISQAQQMQQKITKLEQQLNKK